MSVCLCWIYRGTSPSTDCVYSQTSRVTNPRMEIERPIFDFIQLQYVSICTRFFKAIFYEREEDTSYCRYIIELQFIWRNRHIQTNLALIVHVNIFRHVDKSQRIRPFQILFHLYIMCTVNICHDFQYVCPRVLVFFKIIQLQYKNYS